MVNTRVCTQMPTLKMFIAHQIIFQVALQSYFGIFQVLITMKMQISRSELCSYVNFLKVYLFLVVLGLHCHSGSSLVAASRGHSSLWCPGFSWGARALVVLRHVESSQPGIEPVSPARADSHPLCHQGSPKYKFIIACGPTF